jgi:DNA-binding NtrC family response regulator
MPDETAYLDVSEPDGSTSKFVLPKRGVLLGRSKICDLNLHDTTVSREHAKIIFREGRWIIRDLRSENSTYLNGRRIVEEPLSAGDQLAVGPYRIKFFCAEAKAEVRKPRDAAFDPLDAVPEDPDAPKPKDGTRIPELPTRMIVLGSRVPQELQRAARKDKNVVVETVSGSGPLERIVGCTAHVQAVKKFIRRAAPSDAPVLIRGETGTGKELVAQALAALNPQRKPFAIAIDMGSLDSALAAAELFGHEKGAFTGADRERKGKIELADGATLFLDEIGRAPADVQNKLLRVLETGEFQPLGSRQTRTIDVRLVAATDKNLETMMQQGQFSDALYYRLKGLELRLLPLRERREDIPLLAEHFLAQSRRAPGAPSFVLSEDTVAALCTYAWPGNIRELKRCIESAVTMAEAEVITPSCLPQDVRGGAGDGPGVQRGAADDSPNTVSDNAFRAAKRALLVRALRQTGGNQNQAAGILGISRQAVHQMIQRHYISETEWKTS